MIQQVRRRAILHRLFGYSYSLYFSDFCSIEQGVRWLWYALAAYEGWFGTFLVLTALGSALGDFVH